MTGLDLVNKPITTNNYHIYDIDDLPKIFLGIKVKNKFDEERFSIKNMYKPRLIAHFKRHTQLEPTFLYGIEIKPKKRYIKMLDLLNSKMYLNKNCTYENFIQTYRMLLTSFNLSCHNCYGYLADGMYPIDIEHLCKISRKNLTKEIDSGFSQMVKKNNNPWYLNLYNFNLFILGETTEYKNDFVVNES
tara:strand:- start:8163 stop:8729 length:567 start_codon:yes stop_codon:yes gene_type:complete